MPRIVDLQAETELRFEIPPSASSLTLKLLKGTAEIYGSELCPQKEYKFSGVKYAIFTFDGASIQLDDSSAAAVEYISSDCVVPFYMNLHLCLESLRSTSVPRVLVLGSGRGVCTRTLINYSIRSGRIPMFVDLDIANGTLVFHGVVTAGTMHRMIEPEEGFYTPSTLAFYHGATSISDNFKSLCRTIQHLDSAVSERMKFIGQSKDSATQVKQSGLFALFPGWVEGKSEELLRVAVMALEISIIVVVGNERLSSFIQRSWEGEVVQIISISKSSGLVAREASFRRFQMFQRIREYFYGFLDEYYPYSNTLAFKDVSIWKVEDRVAPPTSALPIGAERKLEELSCSKVEIGQHLLYSILGISSVAVGQDNAHELLGECAVLGFVHVSEVDMQKEKITVLCTSPGKLPSSVFLWGGIKWIEQQSK